MDEIEEQRSSGWDVHRARVSRGIETAALELFAEEGADEVTIDRIVAAAGVSKRTFFRYFATREEILATLPNRSLGQISARVRGRPTSESLLEAFAAAGSATDDADPDHDLWLLWARVVKRSPDAAARALGRSTVSMYETFTELVAERLGIPSDEPRARVLAVAIASVVGYTFQQWVLDGGRVP